MGHPLELFPLAQFLHAQGMDTHTICLPGHGETPQAIGRMDWEDLVHHAQSELVVLQEKGRHIHLVGFCLGGAIGMVLARENPQVFQSLTLVATPYKPVFNWDYGQTHLKHLRTRVLPGLAYLHQSDTGFPKPRFYPHDLIRFYPQMAAFFTEVRQSVQYITVPTLLLHSPLDLTIPYEHSEWLYNTLPGPRNFISLLNCGHQVFPFHVQGLVEEAVFNHIMAASRCQLQAV